VLLVAVVCAADGAIYDYTNVKLPPELLFFRRAGMFSVTDAPGLGAPGYGNSYIKLNLRFEREEDFGDPSFDPAAATELEVLIFDAIHYPNIGYQRPGSQKRQYCCDAKAFRKGICSKLNTLIVGASSASDTDKMMNQAVPFTPILNGSRFHLEHRYQVKTSGLYYFMLASCNPATGLVAIDGHTAWMNPYGYLPGELYGKFLFFKRMSALYLLTGGWWFSMCFRHWKDLIQLQFWITAVVFLGMLETSLKYLDFYSWNQCGLRNTGTMVAGVISSTFKRSISRILVLIVSMGYGVTKSTLGNTMPQILMLGGAYLILSSFQDIYIELSHSKLPGFFDFMLLLLLANLDVIFIFWIFKSLVVTTHQLSSRNQLIKLRVYRRFQYTLGLCVFLSIAWSCRTIFISATEDIAVGGEWATTWMNDAVWEALYFVMLLAIMVLWQPSKNAQRYAFSHEVRRTDCDIDDFDQSDRDDSYLDDEYGGQLCDEDTAHANTDKEFEMTAISQNTAEIVMLEENETQQKME